MTHRRCASIRTRAASTGPPGAAHLERGPAGDALSRRDTDLHRALADPDVRAATVPSGKLGAGRTATLLRAEGSPPVFSPYGWWRQEPQPVWRWACRACGTVDRRWSWPEAQGGEGAPMARYAVNLDDPDGPLLDVPWSCPRGTCHGAVRWHLERTEDVAATGTDGGT